MKDPGVPEETTGPGDSGDVSEPALVTDAGPEEGHSMLARAWNRFFFTEEPVYAAVAYRIFLAAWTACFFISRLPYLEELYTARAVHTPHPLLELVGVPSLPLWAVVGVVTVLFAGLGAFAWGYRAREAHLLVLLLLCFLFGFDISSLRGYGELSFYQWLLAWFMPYDRLRDRTGAVIRAPRWGTRLVMLQFTLVYVFTVGAKTVGGEGWLDGRTLYYALKGQDYGQFLLSAWIRPELRVTRVLGWAVIAGEALVGVGLWIPRARALAMLACIGLHLGMALSLRVSILFHLLMVGHLVLFISPEVWGRGTNRESD